MANTEPRPDDLWSALNPAQAAALQRLQRAVALSRKTPAALDAVTGAFAAIDDDGREIVHRIAIGRGNGPETVDAVASRLSLPQATVLAALQRGLEAVAGSDASA